LISTFNARPLRWFAILAVPFLMLSFTMLVGGILMLVISGQQSLPIAGAGLLFGSLSVFLLLSGGLAELVSRTGHRHVTKFPLLTAVEIDTRDSCKNADSTKTEP